MDLTEELDIGKFGIWIHPISQNCIAVEIGKLTVYFSFRTPIAFRKKAQPRRVCENVWGEVTEKHMAFVEAGKSTDRIKKYDFEKKLKKALSENFLVCANELLKDRLGLKSEKTATTNNINGDLGNGKSTKHKKLQSRLFDI